MSDYRELLIGCGHRRDKRLGLPRTKLEWRNLYTVDNNRRCSPDFIVDLNIRMGRWIVQKDSLRLKRGKMSFIHFEIPGDYWVFKSDSFDEIHAYEVLEHLGEQGDAHFFFTQFAEIWRLLKPGGHLFATVPSIHSSWAWGDPSHRRVIQPETLVFLNQQQYIAQLDCEPDKRTTMSDFRNIYRADFDIVASTDNHQSHLFCLRAIKPSRIKESS